MIETAHLFFPDDGSLLDKVAAYKSVHEANSRAKQSLELANNPRWADSLGERKEIEDAVRISQNSLLIATDSISKADMQRAQDDQLITREEAIELAQLKRQFEMKARRESSSEAQYHSNKAKRGQSQ